MAGFCYTTDCRTIEIYLPCYQLFEFLLRLWTPELNKFLLERMGASFQNPVIDLLQIKAGSKHQIQKRAFLVL